MSVTLEVSKLSGWLNADARCRESKGGHTMRGEVLWPGGGSQRATAVHAACGRGLDCSFGSRARGGAHVEHGVHARDAGGVEAQRLVERRRVLPRVARGAYGAG
eukprot:scaffold26021_cov41-Phaeocystis_antarctica.AAC.1